MAPQSGGEGRTLQMPVGRAGLRGAARDHRLLVFGALVVVLTVTIAAAGLDRNTAPFALVLVPAISAIVVAALADGRAGLGRLFGQIVRWRVNRAWYLAAIGVPLVMWVGIVALSPGLRRSLASRAAGPGSAPAMLEPVV